MAKEKSKSKSISVILCERLADLPASVIPMVAYEPVDCCQMPGHPTMSKMACLVRQIGTGFPRYHVEPVIGKTKSETHMVISPKFGGCAGNKDGSTSRCPHFLSDEDYVTLLGLLRGSRQGTLVADIGNRVAKANKKRAGVRSKKSVNFSARANEIKKQTEQSDNEQIDNDQSGTSHHAVLIISHNCWAGCQSCRGAGCHACDYKGYRDNGRVKAPIKLAWNSPDFSDLEAVGQRATCEACGTDIAELAKEMLEKMAGDGEAVS